jgi:heat shock protein HslJ
MRNLLIAVLILFIFSCKKENHAIENKQILNITWYLTTIQNNRSSESIHYPDTLKYESITFTDSLNTLAISGICNGGSGKYSFSGNKIDINSISTTEIYCKYYQWEEILIHNLDSAYEYKIEYTKVLNSAKKAQLTIFSKGNYNLTFEIHDSLYIIMN